MHAWLPAGEVRASLQIAHGLAEHGARYRRFAEAATQRGFAVYADDHRGHGRTASGGTKGFFAEVQGWRSVLDDLARLGDHVTGAHPGVPKLFFGHSMGSFLGQQVAFERGEQFKGIALSGCASGSGNPLAPVGRVVARIERWRLGAHKPSALLTKMSFGDFNRPFEPSRTKFDWLSRDPAEVDAYVQDPLCGFDASTQLWIDMLDALPGLAAAEHLARLPKSLPMYLTVGERDPVHRGLKDFHKLVEQYEAAGLRDVTVRIWSDARHELLNETNRDEVTAALLDWMEQKAFSA